jgi:hypothetical protein
VHFPPLSSKRPPNVKFVVESRVRDYRVEVRECIFLSGFIDPRTFVLDDKAFEPVNLEELWVYG